MQKTIIEPHKEGWFAHLGKSGISCVADDADYLADHEGLSLKKIYPVVITVIDKAICRDDCETCEGCSFHTDKVVKANLEHPYKSR